MIRKKYILTLIAGAGMLGLLLHASPGFSQTSADAPVNQQPTTPDESIRPCHVNFSDEALADLHRRIVAARWPDRELVNDATQII
jgi:hypothetical protein